MKTNNHIVITLASPGHSAEARKKHEEGGKKTIRAIGSQVRPTVLHGPCVNHPCWKEEQPLVPHPTQNPGPPFTHRDTPESEGDH